MNNKPIQDLIIDDFIGTWNNSKQNGANVYLQVSNNDNATLAINRTIICYGTITIEYFGTSETCTNCLKLTIGNMMFDIRQIDNEGFYLTIEGNQIHMEKK